MTKDWERYKPEIRRLYVAEAKTLDEVQRVLKGEGFHASIRAYRMKLDAWGFRKNASSHVRKRRRLNGPKSPPTRSSEVQTDTTPLSFDSQQRIDLHRPSTSSQPEGPEEAEEEPNETSLNSGRPPSDSQPKVTYKTSAFEVRLRCALAGYTFALPFGAMKASKLMRMLAPPCPEDVRNYFTLELLLAKWQSDGSYLQIALDLLPDYDAAFVTDFYGGNIFKVIDENVEPHEKLVLTKACLERMLVALATWPDEYQSGNPIYAWQEPLWAAARATSWKEVKSNLRDERLGQETMGESFFSCALLVIAQDVLARCMKHIKAARGITWSNGDIADVRELRNDYMEVLEDFANAAPEFDLDRSWYKFALKMSKWEDRKVEEAQQTPKPTKGPGQERKQAESSINDQNIAQQVQRQAGFEAALNFVFGYTDTTNLYMSLSAVAPTMVKDLLK